MDGIICIYKEKGITSFDVVAAVRRIYGTKRVGHGGTLDPMAEGVLPVFIGKATKAADFCPDDTKQYLAGFKFGLTTDTQDITGQILTSDGGYVSRNKMPMIERVFSGELMQTPPMYSAVKVNGMKLYDLARKGEIVERQPRKIYVYRLQIQNYEDNEGEMLVTCSKGTYIRTLIHDIGQYLGAGGVMTSLVRTRSGVFTVNNCYRLKELESKSPDELEALLLPLEKLYDKMPRAYLDEEQTRLFRNGAVLDADRIHFDKIQDKGYYIESSDGIFLGLGRISADHQLEVIRRFNTDSAEYARMQALKKSEEEEKQKALQRQKEEEEAKRLALQREQEEEERRRAEAAEAKADLERRKRESAERRAAAEKKQKESVIDAEKAIDTENIFPDNEEPEEGNMTAAPETEALISVDDPSISDPIANEFQNALPPEFQQMTEAVNDFHKEIGNFLKNAAAASHKASRQAERRAEKTEVTEDVTEEGLQSAEDNGTAESIVEEVMQDMNTDTTESIDEEIPQSSANDTMESIVEEIPQDMNTDTVESLAAELPQQDADKEIEEKEDGTEPSFIESEEDMSGSPDIGTNDIKTISDENSTVDPNEEYSVRTDASAQSVSDIFEQAQNALKDFQEETADISSTAHKQEEDEDDLSYLDLDYFEEQDAKKSSEEIESALDRANEELLNMLSGE